jgi:hypothetical protein
MSAALLCPLTSLAGGKPDRHDPVRKELVAAIRRHPAFAAWRGETLDIRRVWVSETHGYVCTLVKHPDGSYRMTDDVFDVHQIVLKPIEGRWTAVADMAGFSESRRQVQCATDPQGQVDDAFLEALASNPQMALNPPELAVRP